MITSIRRTSLEGNPPPRVSSNPINKLKMTASHSENADLAIGVPYRARCLHLEKSRYLPRFSGLELNLDVCYLQRFCISTFHSNIKAAAVEDSDRNEKRSSLFQSLCAPRRKVPTVFRSEISASERFGCRWPERPRTTSSVSYLRHIVQERDLMAPWGRVLHAHVPFSCLHVEQSSWWGRIRSKLDLRYCVSAENIIQL